MKKKIAGIFVCLLLIATTLPSFGMVSEKQIDIVYNSQKSGIEWTKIYGGSDFDFLSSIISTQDGGYLLAGKTYSWSEGIGDVWLVKTDSEGNEIWNTSFGGIGIEAGPDILLQLDDGSYIIPTDTESFGNGDFDIWLIKTDITGNMIWNKTYGGKGFDFGGNLCETDIGDFLICGTTDSYGLGKTDAWLLKTDSDGNEIWNKTYGGPDEEWCYSIGATVDDCFILCGDKHISNKRVAWLFKVDTNGNLIWEKTYKGKFGESGGYRAKQSNDGGYVIIGETNVLVLGEIWLGKRDMWLIKTDTQGDKIWDKKYGRFIFDEGGIDILEISNDDFIITGFSRGFGGFIYQSPQPPYLKASIIKTDANGNIKGKEYVGDGICYSSAEINDSIFVVAGIKQSGKSWDGALIKLE